MVHDIQKVSTENLSSIEHENTRTIEGFLNINNIPVGHVRALPPEQRNAFLIKKLFSPEDIVNASRNRHDVIDLEDRDIGLILVKPECFLTFMLSKIFTEKEIEFKTLETRYPTKEQWLDTYGYMLSDFPNIVNVYITHTNFGLRPIIFKHPIIDQFNNTADADKVFDSQFCGKAREGYSETIRGGVVLPHLINLGFKTMTSYASSFDYFNYYKDSPPEKTFISFNGVHIPKDMYEKSRNFSKLCTMSNQKNIIKKVSAGGIIYQDGKYLTIKWLSEGTVEIPKGTVEPNESIEEACVREILEETGYNTEIVAPLTVSNFTFDWHDGKTYNKTVHYFLLRRVDGKEPTPNREDNEDFENNWQTAEATLDSLSFEDMKQAMQKSNPTS